MVKKDKSKKKTSKVDSVLLGAVIGAAVGSVVGVTLAPQKGKKTRKAVGKEFDKIKKNSQNMSKSLLKRIRLYLKKRNERKRKGK